jgi:hypothetical protein
MREHATLLVFGALIGLGCASESPMPAQPSGIGSAGTAGAVAAGSPAAAGGEGAAPGATAGSAAGAAAPVTSVPSGSAGAPASGAAAGSAAGMAGSNAPPAEGSFKAAYNLALREMCPSCHISGGIFSSPDLSSEERAYASLVDKDASTTQPGVCGGMGKLVTPGNCETSLLYNKISQATPTCGRRMPLSSTTVSQAGIDALCAWIKAGAMKD